MKAYEFLDLVLKEVKYKSRHAEIRAELQSHIEELTEQYKKAYGDYAEDMAVKCMGEACEVGGKINRQYRMPFNNTYGIVIWSFINTALIYLLYPVWIYIWRYYPTAVTFAAIVPVVYAVLNILYLKRGHFKFALRDWRDILIGTLAGVAASIGGLLLASSFFKFGYYPYGAMCEIPIKWSPSSFDMPMALFCFWVCWMIYMLSLAGFKNTKDKGIFVPRTDLFHPFYVNMGDGSVEYNPEDEDFHNPYDVFSDRNKK